MKKPRVVNNVSWTDEMLEVFSESVIPSVDVHIYKKREAYFKSFPHYSLTFQGRAHSKLLKDVEVGITFEFGKPDEITDNVMLLRDADEEGSKLPTITAVIKTGLFSAKEISSLFDKSLTSHSGMLVFSTFYRDADGANQAGHGQEGVRKAFILEEYSFSLLVTKG